EGVYHFVDGDGEKLTFNDVIPSSTQKTLKKKLVEAYKAMGAADPEDRADTLMTTLLAGELVLVQGTPTVRATSNYDSRYKKSETGWNSLTKPEVHHMHPLFLGGSHTLDNLIALEGLSGKLHDEIHSIFDTLSVNGVGMNPNTLQSKFASSLKPGYAVVLPDGTVRLFTHDEPPTP
ncbi:MAG TPA: HNH endonuclease signature motif containing protein, partial [Myxococcota bacterium]|nr:HNH endonuclease signature motif containing protein [Myxococcota bacterium]